MPPGTVGVKVQGSRNIVLQDGVVAEDAHPMPAPIAAPAPAAEPMALRNGTGAWRPLLHHPLRPDDAPPDAPVQDAHTRFRTLARLTLPQASDPRFATTRAALVEAVPTTGRRHQIRRHLKHLAHPIIGDATHGKGPLNRWWAERLGQHQLRLAAPAGCGTGPASVGAD
eukprot:gene4737-6049_t